MSLDKFFLLIKSEKDHNNNIFFLSKLFSLSLFKLPLQLISCCMLSTLRMSCFYKALVTALRSVIVLNCLNLELGSLHHIALLQTDGNRLRLS